MNSSASSVGFRVRPRVVWRSRPLASWRSTALVALDDLVDTGTLDLDDDLGAVVETAA